MSEMWIEILMIVNGLAGSFFDIKNKKIPIAVMAVFPVLSAALLIIRGSREYMVENMMLSVIPGIFMCLLAFVCRGKIGIGDGIVITGMGIGLGIQKCLTVLMTALFLSAIFAGALLALKKVKRDYHLPFMPFITAGLIIAECAERIFV